MSTHHTAHPQADLSAAKAILKRFIGEGLEPFTWCVYSRSKVINALVASGGDAATIQDCRKGRRCRSGLCPVCIRLLRRRLLRFLVAKRLHRLQWYFVTVFVAGWTKLPDDASAFGALRDHHPIENFTTQLKRLGGQGLIVIGSIETVYKVVANRPVGKPFHLHFIISGRSDEQILSAAHTCFDLDQRVVEPVRAEAVKPTIDDFLNTASYAFKQPFWKKSTPRSTVKGRRQWPKPPELAELIGNIGVHSWTGRLILVGVRNDGGRFRLTAKLSATQEGALRADGDNSLAEGVEKAG